MPTLASQLREVERETDQAGIKFPTCQHIFSVIFLNVSFLKNEMDLYLGQHRNNVARSSLESVILKHF